MQTEQLHSKYTVQLLPRPFAATVAANVAAI